MIYFTGDTHQSIDIHKLSTKNFNPQCTKDDYLIVLGDFGCVWNGIREDDYWLSWFEDKPYTTLFIPGNHENYDLLRQFPLEAWRGGCVRKIRPSVIMLERGYVFDLPIDSETTRSFFCMGGAESHDKEFRKEGRSWWKDEMPADYEYDIAYRSLANHHWSVDYVLTHCARKSVHAILTGDFASENALIKFFNFVQEHVEYKMWLFGHYHQDRLVTTTDLCMYDHIVSSSMLEAYIAASESLRNGDMKKEG